MHKQTYQQKTKKNI